MLFVTKADETLSEWEQKQARDPLSPAPATDRRRPGRLKDVSPHLTPLLRFRPSAEQIAAARRDPAESEDDDDLRPARGIALGVLVSLAFWVALLVALIGGR